MAGHWEVESQLTASLRSNFVLWKKNRDGEFACSVTTFFSASNGS